LLKAVDYGAGDKALRPLMGARIWRMVIALVALLICAPSYAATATAPATRPADDGLVANATDSIENVQLPGFSKDMGDRAAAVLLDVKKADLERVARLSDVSRIRGIFRHITERATNRKRR